MISKVGSGLASLGFGREVFEPEHDAFREGVRRFFRSEVVPNVREWEKQGFFPADLFRKAGEAGLLCAGIPEEYGGMGGDLRHHLVLQEEHGFTPEVTALEGGLSIDFTSYAILNDGTEEQRREWLPQMAAGEMICEIALSEPDAGSDATAIKTVARRDGDDYIINGQKSWVSNGPILTHAMVVCRTKTDDRDTFSSLMVPLDLPGIVVRDTDLMLKSAGGVAEIFFTDVRVPARNLLGNQEGNGIRSALKLITLGRTTVAMKALAACEVGLELTLDYTRQRKAFGQTVFEFQNTQFELAGMSAEIAAGRALVDQTVKALSNGTLSVDDAARAKLFASELEGRVLDRCVQLHGGVGFSNEFMISKMYVLARSHRIYGGTSEIMRSIIARSFL